MREWAQVSGTCRTTWQLQLHSISLTRSDRLEDAGVLF